MHSSNESIKFNKGELMVTRDDMRLWYVVSRLDNGYLVQNVDRNSDTKIVPFNSNCVKVAIV